MKLQHVVLCVSVSAQAFAQPFLPIDHKGESPSSHIAYMPNEGQLTALQGGLVPAVKFYSVECNPQIFLTKSNEIFFALGARDTSLSTPDTIYRIGFKFTGSTESTPVSYEELPETNNFVLGHCPNGIFDVHAARRVISENIYPHVDLHLYSNQWGPKLYLVMRPGFDPSLIKMGFQGQDSLLQDAFGNLMALIEENSILLPKGMCYQQINGTTQLISAGLDYELISGGGTATFAFEPYDPNYPLIIDISASFGPSIGSDGPRPEWCTFYGSTEGDSPHDALALPNGGVLIAGTTTSQQFPLFNEQSDAFDGGREIFYQVFDEAYEREYSTFFGGNGIDYLFSIALSPDASSVYLFGKTNSTDLPVLSAGGFHQTVANSGWACYIAQFALTSSLGSPIRATYFGNNTLYNCSCIRTDSNGDVYVTGTMSPSTSSLTPVCDGSTNQFPVCNSLGSNAYFQNYRGGSYDAYLTRFNADFDIVHSTIFGGDGEDVGYGLAIDETNDRVFLGGYTRSLRASYSNCQPPLQGSGPYSFPLCDPGSGYFQNDLNLTNTSTLNADAFICSFSTQTGSLTWSTFFGGEGYETYPHLVMNDASGNVAITGNTSTPVYSDVLCTVPTQGFPRCGEVLQSAYGGSQDVFLATFDLADYSLKWSSFLGGGRLETPASLRSTSGKRIVVAGVTQSGSMQSAPFPTQGNSSYYYRGIHSDSDSDDHRDDGFVTLIDLEEPVEMVMSTFLGGVGRDELSAAVMFGNEKLYAVGNSTSMSAVPFSCPPTPNPYCYLSYSTVSTGMFDGLYAQLKYDYTIGLDNVVGTEQEFGITVYPNPTFSLLSLEHKQGLFAEGLAPIEVYDPTGRLVEILRARISSSTKAECTLSDYHTGVYFARVSSSDGTWSTVVSFVRE